MIKVIFQRYFKKQIDLKIILSKLPKSIKNMKWSGFNFGSPLHLKQPLDFWDLRNCSVPDKFCVIGKIGRIILNEEDRCSINHEDIGKQNYVFSQATGMFYSVSLKFLE